MAVSNNNPNQTEEAMDKPGAAAYITKIRNEKKKEYARAYWGWICSNNVQPEPDRPEGLSYMAAQAVRITLLQYGYRTV